jgi:post-segregation antitoxin (ccd killing protein)
VLFSKRQKPLGINVSRSAEAGIAEAVKLHKQEKWLKENARALASSNSYVEDVMCANKSLKFVPAFGLHRTR